MLAGCAGDDPASLEGTYDLDPRAFADAALERRRATEQERLAKTPPKDRGTLTSAWLRAARAEAQRTALTLQLREGGRFTARVRFGREKATSAGSWGIRDGEVVLVTEAERGRRLQKPYETSARIEDDGLRFEGADLPIPFRLRRRTR